ncbi:hypothetical protein CANTEDRAFT_112439 [Yamadazyma tenuis ATCC 10573]|uniref:PCI domain-containing protein n=1 Tax=Candida tenuis (strain ATCC 10573 / BCRC 21748 / CBS 615 / JCM 9827 / NBRC 10315 / NRRL Y-1498 / VKM Y-70) TaxID=590646 RepID=G3AX69_CANTC|nr:uncharacterized protein CANTEDRAFT_112439 [Yamadazyma tenuis ATCC 10573]EGV66702.1 hypothetical protein CANTEDRAFT_112439 [Yamadazyma tenuis ATCC 10573]
MESIHSLTRALSDKNVYNYFTTLCQLPVEETSDPQIIKLLNTLELFAFGNIRHYWQYRANFIDLTREQAIKLVKLSIWDVLSQVAGGTIAMDTITKDPGLVGALTQIDGHKDVELALEVLLLEMCGESVRTVIDEVNGTITVVEVTKYRDVYDSRLYGLKVLQPQDIRSLTYHKQQLEQWLGTSVWQVQAEYGKVVEKSKKRRQPSEV